MDTKGCQTLVESRGKTSQCLESPQSPHLSPNLPLRQFRGKEIQTALFTGFKQSKFLFPLQFFSGGEPHMLEIWQEGMLRWHRGLRWRSPACPPCCSLPQQRVCLQLQRHVLKLPGTGDSFFMLNEMKFPLLPHLHLNAGNL